MLDRSVYSLDYLYSFLPHGKSLHAITKIIDIKEDGLSAMGAMGHFDSANVILDSGERKVSLFASIEYFAQAAALFQVIKRINLQTTSLGQASNLGFVVAVKSMEIIDPLKLFLKIGEQVMLQINCSDKIGGAYSVSGLATNGLGQSLIEAKLMLYEV